VSRSNDEAKEPEDIQGATPNVAPNNSNFDTLSGSVARSGLWAMGGQIATILASLLSTPFTIRLLHQSGYGTWIVMQSLVSYIVVADVGMTSASTRLGSSYQADGDDKGEAAVVWTALAISLATTLAICVIAWVVAPYLLPTFLHLGQSGSRTAVTAFRIICVALIAQSISGTANTPQLIRLRWGAYTLITSGTSVLQALAVPTALAVLSGGLITAASVVAGAYALAAIGNCVVSARIQPRVKRPSFRKKLVRPLMTYGGGLTISGLAAFPLTNAERLLLGYFRSARIVGYYGVASLVGNVLRALPASVVGPLFPALSKLDSSSDTESRDRLFSLALQCVVAIVTPMTLAAIFAIRPFLRLWAGLEYARNSAVPFDILVIGVCANSMAYVPYSYLLAVGRTKLIARIHLAELLPYVALAALSTRFLAATGAAMAVSARLIVDAAIFFRCVHADGVLLHPLPRRRGRFCGVTALLAISFIGSAAVAESLIERIAILTLLLSADWLAVYILVLEENDRAWLRGTAQHMLKRSSKLDATGMQ
jgi:O-antigen/teichoic acid export membrane protein